VITDHYSKLDLYRAIVISKNPTGGQTVRWNLVSIYGVIFRKQSQMNQVGGKSGELTDAVLICEMADIAKGDRVRDLDGVLYQVKGNPNNPMKKYHHLELDLQILTGVDVNVSG
jgi:hypothetical protein